MLLSGNEKKNRKVPDSGGGQGRTRYPKVVFNIIIFLRKSSVKGGERQRYSSFPGHAGRKYCPGPAFCDKLRTNTVGTGIRMMESGKRLEFADRAKGIGILMVVFSHLSSMTGFGNALWSWYNPFMLTMFFMIAGGMRRYRDTRIAGGPGIIPENGKNSGSGGSGSSAGETFPGFLRRRARGLLLPYFVFDLLALGLQTVLAYWRGGVPEALLKLQTGFVRIVTLRGLGPDWFLPALFLAEVLLALCLRTGRKCGAAALFLLSAAAVFCLGGERLAAAGPFRFVIVKGLAASGFLVMGYVLAPAARKILALSQEDPRAVTWGFAAASFAGTLFIAGRYNLDFNQLDFGSRPLFLYLDALFGTCFVLCISRIPDLAGRMPADFGFLQEFGRESLTIMCTHLEWQIVPVVHFGWAAAAGLASGEGKRFYAEILVRLCLVMAAELGLIPVLRSLFPWLYRKNRGGNAPRQMVS